MNRNLIEGCALSRLRFALVAVLFFAGIASCTHSEEPLTGDPFSGTWIGDFGPGFYDRNTISLELKWDGHDLTGMVKPGVPGARMYRNFAGFPIENASFDAKNGTVRFEATYQPKGRRYLIQGKVRGNALTGTWIRPEDKSDGDFKLTRKAQ
jgi:hypothetical protein